MKTTLPIHNWLSLSATVFLAMLLQALFMAGNGYAAHETTITTVSFGDGRVAFFWPPSPLFYTGGGWLLKNVESGKVVARWGQEDLDRGLKKLSARQQEKLRPFLDKLKATRKNEDQSSMTSLLLMGGMSDFTAARVLGMGCILKKVAKGTHRYQLFLVDTKKKSHRYRELRSQAVDGYHATVPPPAVQHLRGQSGNNGVQLHWDQPEQTSGLIPAPLVRISRAGETGPAVELSEEPIWIDTGRDTGKPAYIDSVAPLEAKLTYTIRRQDIFGRLSEPATVTVFNEDIAARTPPRQIRAEAGELRVKLRWQPNDNPYSCGYVIERSRRANGIYEVITPKGLDRKTDTFTDTGVKGGFVYYYRVRAMGPRGDVGPAPDPVSVMVLTDGAPDRPGDLKARIEPTRVILSWKAMPLPVAGYIVEKRKKGEDAWVRINSRLATRPELEDPINLGDYGRRQYRVTAVAFGNARSRPSSALTVSLPGHALVPPPLLTDAGSEKGVVRLRFQAGKPGQRTDKLLLVRGNDARDQGLVIMDDLDGDSTEFEDSMVKPGEDYWYALIAVDRDGHRSAMGNKLFVIVASPEIPRPDRPEVRFEGKPFRRVVISFDRPEGFLRAAVMRQVDDGPWVTIVRDLRGTDTTVDADPPLAGTVRYRLAYMDEAKAWGQPSRAATIKLKKEQP